MDSVPADAGSYWVADLGGGRAPRTVTFSTVRPDGKTAHGGVYDGINVSYHGLSFGGK